MSSKALTSFSFNMEEFGEACLISSFTVVADFMIFKFCSQVSEVRLSSSMVLDEEDIEEVESGEATEDEA